MQKEAKLVALLRESAIFGTTNACIEETLHRLNLERTRKTINKVVCRNVAIGAAVAVAKHRSAPSMAHQSCEQVKVKVDSADGMIAKLIAANEQQTSSSFSTTIM